MIVRMKIIGHYSLFVTHYSLLGIQTPRLVQVGTNVVTNFDDECQRSSKLKSYIKTFVAKLTPPNFPNVERK